MGVTAAQGTNPEPANTSPAVNTTANTDGTHTTNQPQHATENTDGPARATAPDSAPSPAPAPAPAPTKAAPTAEDTEKMLVVTELRQLIEIGRSTQYDWAASESTADRDGTFMDGKRYVDTTAVCPRVEMLSATYAQRPWTVELSDGHTTPRKMQALSAVRADISILPPLTSSVAMMKPGTTGIWTLPLWTGKKESAYNYNGQALVWSGNQAETVTSLVKQLDTWHERHSKQHADPIHLWVVIETRQPPVSNDPMVAVQLDGRHIIRLLRQKAAAVIYDKSGQWQQNSMKDEWVHPFPWKSYHLAFLLGSDRRWTPLDSIGKAYVTNDKARRRPDLEVPNVTYRILADAAISTTSLFYRFMNDSPNEVGSTVARGQSVLQWNGARRLPPPDDGSTLWEYTIPITMEDHLRNALDTDPPTQYINISDPASVYIILQAKPSKGPATATTIQGPEDLETEIYGAMGMDPPEERGPVLPDIFPQGVPHMRWQRLTTVKDVSYLPEIARRLWEGGRLVIKRLDTDQRVRFGTWARQENKPARAAPRERLPNEATVAAPYATPEETVRRYMALFGEFESVTCDNARGGMGQKSYTVTYKNPDSATIAHNVTFDTALGEMWVTGDPNPEAAANIKASLSDPDAHPEDVDWWRFEVGKLMGAEQALTTEQNRLTAGNLAQAASMATNPAPTSINQ